MSWLKSVVDGFSEKYKREFERRLRLNRQILKNKYWFLPYEDSGKEFFQPVGRGVKSSEFCGAHRGFKVCKDVEAHKGVVKDGVDYTGKIVVRHKHWWCTKPSCPVCFIRGYAVRQARFFERRLDEAVKRGFGKVEHIIVSPCKEDYDLPEKVLREKVREALRVRGVYAGGMIFHCFRIDRERNVLKVGKHYHVLGFVLGGYKCRGCKRKNNCLKGCGGFDDRSYQAFLKDGYIVKVTGERVTVFGTAWYQLNHASVKVGLKRFHTVTWFGKTAYNNFKVEGVDLKAELKAEVVCPVCGSEMVDCRYDGDLHFAKNVGDVDYVAWFGVDACHSSDFVEIIGGGGSGSYG